MELQVVACSITLADGRSSVTAGIVRKKIVAHLVVIKAKQIVVFICFVNYGDNLSRGWERGEPVCIAHVSRDKDWRISLNSN